MTITTEKPLAELVQELTSEQAAEVRDFVEFVLLKARRAELERQAVAHGYPPGWASQVFGSIDDPTFVRPPQEEPEDRVQFE